MVKATKENPLGCATKNQFNQNYQLDKYNSVLDASSDSEKKAWAAYEGTLNDETVFDDEDLEYNDFQDAEHDPLTPEWGKDKEHGYQLVGNGVVTDRRNCGHFGAFWGCNRTDLHDKVMLDGENLKGKVYVKKVFRSCDKSTCPECFLKGWAVREAQKIEERTVEFQKKHGLAEHIIVSVPESDYGLSIEKLRAKAAHVTRSRGIIGGARIFHAFRYRSHSKNVDGVHNPRGWFYAPHFHIIGFFRESYSRCRHCENHFDDGIINREKCMGCSGFEGLTRRMFEREEKRRAGSGYIVKVKGQRKTIGGTAWYQLSHAAVKVGVKKFHVVNWFGICNSNKEIFTKKDKHVEHGVCPICQHELEKLKYIGAKGLTYWLGRFWEKDFYDDFLDVDGNPQWILAPKP